MATINTATRPEVLSGTFYHSGYRYSGHLPASKFRGYISNGTGELIGIHDFREVMRNKPTQRRRK